ncbi:MAG: hypothetical protein R2818_03655 [Flavobacteriales bacterium]
MVGEDVFHKAIAPDERPKAGGLGVKTIDGKGNFLPESKRGLPTPAVAFYKIGLTRLFPHSRTFGCYYLWGTCPRTRPRDRASCPVPACSRKSTLDEVGLWTRASSCTARTST